MNNSFSLQRISKTGNLAFNLIFREYKVNLMADFMQIKGENPNLKQFEIANHLGYSSSTLQRYSNDINMLSPYRIQSNITNKRTENTSNTNFDNNSHRNPDVKRHQMTSNDPIKPETNTKSNNKNRNIPKAGSMNENIEFSDNDLDEILQNNNKYME